MSEITIAAAYITAALISSDKVLVKSESTEGTVKNAADIFGMVAAELMNRDKENKLYRNP